MPGLPLALLVPDAAGPRGVVLRDRVADGLAVACALGYGAVMVPLGDALSPRAAIPWQADVVLGVICCLKLLLRRRYPVALAATITPVAAVSVMATGAVAVALFTVAVRRRASVALVLLVAYVATGPAYHLLHGDPGFPAWVDVAARVVTGAAALGWGMFVQAYRRLTASLREHATRLEAEQEMRVDQARLTERARIAREMHDVLAHRMSLVSLHAGALEVRPDARPEEISIAAGAIRTGVHEALQELRTVIGVLREGATGPPEPPQPGLADLPALIDDARSSGMTVRFDDPVPAPGPPVVAGRTAYRVVQEALTNARKHAPGQPVTVHLAGAPGTSLRITITNPLPGTGVSAVPGSGLGLVGIEERVWLAGGRVEHGAGADGFSLRAWLPWPA
ncbi:sensor histidine kinase [Nucisporomicrobium flavum]|uniref:sensor histidine kinase n=1 Tax=Nucisporomicrobium flavum TaxID=2785915 RepID=UPI003C3065BA